MRPLSSPSSQVGQGPVSGNIPSATAKGPGARSAPAWGRLARPLAPLLEAGWPRANPADPRPAIAVKGSFRGDWDLILSPCGAQRVVLPLLGYTRTAPSPSAPEARQGIRGRAAVPCRVGGARGRRGGATGAGRRFLRRACAPPGRRPPELPPPPPSLSCQRQFPAPAGPCLAAAPARPGPQALCFSFLFFPLFFPHVT